MVKALQEERSISIREFRRAIRKLPEDEIKYREDVWYRSQKEHWLGWLGQYHTAGAYGRKADNEYDAKHAYNHAVNPGLVLYLVEAIPLSDEVISAARMAEAESGPTMMAKVGAIRKVVPWGVIHQAMFEK